MSVDRGGLAWNVETSYQDDAVRRFRDDVKEIRTLLAGVSKAAERLGLGRFGRDAGKLIDASRKAATAREKQADATERLEGAEARLERLRARIKNQIEDAKLLSQNAELKVLQNRLRLLQQELGLGKAKQGVFSNQLISLRQQVAKLAEIAKLKERQIVAEDAGVARARQQLAIAREIAKFEDARKIEADPRIRQLRERQKQVEEQERRERRINDLKERQAELSDRELQKEQIKLDLLRQEARLRQQEIVSSDPNLAKLQQNLQERQRLATAELQRQKAIERIARAQAELADREMRDKRIALSIAKQIAAFEDRKRIAADPRLRELRQEAAAANTIANAEDRIALARNKSVQQALVAAEVEQRIAAFARERERLNNRELQQATAEADVARRLAEFKRQQLVIERLIAEARRQGFNLQDARVRQGLGISEEDARAAGLVRRTLRERIRDFLQLNDATKQTESNLTRVGSAFKRLALVFGAFFIFHRIVRLLRDAVAEAINFNRRIETAELGIASLFTAVGGVRDAAGQSVDRMRALALAEGEARRQIQLLRRDALLTKATFDELVETFQIAVGPGLQAGLNVDEIRRLTVSIAQAAGAIGLPQNQLSEEIRSILSGTIQQRTTRIAAVMGITNEDIRRAKEAGKLVEFLEARFAAFNTAGEKALNTFDGLLARVKDAFALLLGTGSERLFTNLKNSLRDVFDAITDQDPLTGLITPDPQALKVVEAISDAMAQVVQLAIDFVKNLSAEEIVKLVEVFATGLVGALQLAVAFANSFVETLSISFAVINQLLFAIAKLPILEQIFDLENVESVAAGVGVVLGTLAAIKLSVLAITALIAAVRGVVLSLNVAVVVVKTTFAAISLLIAGIGVAIGSAKTAALGLKSAALLTGVAFSSWSATLLLAAAIIGTLLFLTKQLSDEIVGMELTTLTWAKLVKEAYTDLGRRAKQAFVEARTFVEEFNKDGLEGISRAHDIIERQRELQDRLAQDRVDAIIAANDEATLENLFKDTFSKIADSVAEKTTQVLDIIENKSIDFGDVLLDLPAIIERSNAALGDQSELLKQIEDSAKEAQAALDVERSSFGLDQAAGVVREVAQTRNEIAKQTKVFLDAEREATLQARNAQAEQLRVQREIGKLRGQDSEAVGTLIALSREVLNTQNAISQARVRAVEAQLRLNNAQQTFNEEQISAAQTDVTTAKARLESQEKTLEALQAQAKAIGETVTNRKLVKLLIEQTLIAEGQEAGAAARLVEIAESRFAIEEQINDVLTKRLETISLEAISRQLTDIADLAEQLDRTKLQRFADDPRTSRSSFIVRAIQLEISLINERRAAIEQTAEADRKALTSELTRQSLRLANARAAIEAEQKAISSAETKAKLLNDELASRQQLLALLLRSGAQATPEFGITGEQAATRFVQQIGTLRSEVTRLQSEIANAETELGKNTARRENLIVLQERERSLVAAINALNVNQTTQIEAQEKALELVNAQLKIEENRLNRIVAIQESASQAFNIAVREGIAEGLNILGGDEGSPFFQGIRELFTTLTTDLGSFVGDTVVEAIAAAFAEGDVGDVILSAFGNLFQQIASQLIATLVNQLIFSALQQFLNAVPAQFGAAAATQAAAIALNTASLALAGASTSLQAVVPQLIFAATQLQTAAANLAAVNAVSFIPGLAKGGNVAEAWKNAKGYAGGGHIRPIRPRNLDPRDKVPIWADPKEWIIRGSSVRKYGEEFMHLLNVGAIDPSIARSLAGIQRTRLFSKLAYTPKAGGMAAGGPISRAGGGASPETQMPAIVGAFPVDSGTLERLLKGDPEASFRFFREHKSEINAIING